MRLGIASAQVMLCPKASHERAAHKPATSPSLPPFSAAHESFRMLIPTLRQREWDTVSRLWRARTDRREGLAMGKRAGDRVNHDAAVRAQ